MTDSTMTEIPLVERLECAAYGSEDGAIIREAAAMLKAAADALESAKETLLHVNAESGYCCCGDPVDGHTIGSGHSPVDADQYAVQQTVDQIDNTLASLKQPGGV